VVARGGEDLLEVGNAGEDGRDRLEAHSHRGGEQAGDGGLAGARRPPEDDRGKPSCRDHSPDRAFGAGEMLLPDDFIETLGPEPIGERGALGQRPGGGSGGVVGGEQIGHGPTLPQYAAFCTAIDNAIC
jgi:hypothetical protein